MTTWGSIRTEFQENKHKNIRLKYMKRYVKHTGRNLIIYVSDFISGQKPGHLTMLNNYDKTTFADTIRELDRDLGLDILIESPGGMGTVAESIADMLRLHFNSIRFIVPNMAKSAATILCLSGDEILMNEQSELGPIDPQMPQRMPNGEVRYSPAFLIIKQFESLLQTSIKNPNAGAILAPYLQMYFPSFLQDCYNAINFSRIIAKELLKRYMFSNLPNRDKLADDISKHLSEFKNFLNHARSVNIEYARNILKLKVFDLRNDKKLDDIVNRIYLSIRETFNRQPQFVKLCENNLGHGTVTHLN
jgi:hypothetical protein